MSAGTTAAGAFFSASRAARNAALPACFARSYLHCASASRLVACAARPSAASAASRATAAAVLAASSSAPAADDAPPLALTAVARSAACCRRSASARANSASSAACRCARLSSRRMELAWSISSIPSGRPNVSRFWAEGADGGERERLRSACGASGCCELRSLLRAGVPHVGRRRESECSWLECERAGLADGRSAETALTGTATNGPGLPRACSGRKCLS